MQQYELTVLVHPDLESEIDKTIAKVKSLVTDNGGKVVKEDNWGKKKLAYTIKREEFAVYLYMDVELPSEAPLKISNTLNISDYALRYLLVKVDEKELAKREASKKKSDNDEEE
ncbi:MAG TPA: 30S ribosomal protein S6 [Candidatus Saccharimonadales bacterium]